MAFRIGRLAVATLRLAAAMATTLILPAAAAKAEPVSINRNRGQGFAVSHNGNCYVILPAHVHGRGTALTLSTGSPPIVGAASVFQSFMPGMDLSVAYVSGGLDGRCGDRFADLPRNIDPLIGPGGAVSFVRVSAAGQIERVPARVTSLLYETMEIEVAEGETATVFRGTSGAFVFAGDTPVGMIIRAPDDRHAEVLRIDAIAARLDRLLAGGIGAAPEEPVAEAPSQSEGGIGLSGLAAGITRCSAEPATPETSCWAMAEGSSPLIVPADSVPFVIEIDLAGEEFGAGLGGDDEVRRRGWRHDHAAHRAGRAHHRGGRPSGLALLRPWRHVAARQPRGPARGGAAGRRDPDHGPQRVETGPAAPHRRDRHRLTSSTAL